MYNIVIKKTFIVILMFLFSCSKGEKCKILSKNNATSTFSLQNQKKLVFKVSQKLTQSEDLREVSRKNNRPSIFVGNIGNKTSEPIDIDRITNLLKSQVIKTRIFFVVNKHRLDTITQKAQISRNQLSDTKGNTSLGKLWGVKYIMYADVSSIEIKSENNNKEKYYKITLIIENIENNEQIWLAEAEIKS